MNLKTSLEWNLPAGRICSYSAVAERTQETYLYRAKKINEYFNKPPGQITNEELRQYFLYLKNEKKYKPTLKPAIKITSTTWRAALRLSSTLDYLSAGFEMNPL